MELPLFTVNKKAKLIGSDAHSKQLLTFRII